MLLDNEIAFNEAVIEERDQGIQEIQQQIGEVSEIFKDLAVLVHEQGTMIGKSSDLFSRSHQFLFVSGSCRHMSIIFCLQMILAPILRALTQQLPKESLNLQKLQRPKDLIRLW